MCSIWLLSDREILWGTHIRKLAILIKLTLGYNILVCTDYLDILDAKISKMPLAESISVLGNKILGYSFITKGSVF